MSDSVGTVRKVSLCKIHFLEVSGCYVRVTPFTLVVLLDFQTYVGKQISEKVLAKQLDNIYSMTGYALP